MSDKLPDWAIERALTRFPRPSFVDGKPWTILHIRRFDADYTQAVRFLAEQIYEHEEPPVDPLLIEARALAFAQAEIAKHPRSPEIMEGGLDHTPQFGVPLALAALKRGVEIAYTEGLPK